jgi:hypothetical protein
MYLDLDAQKIPEPLKNIEVPEQSPRYGVTSLSADYPWYAGKSDASTRTHWLSAICANPVDDKRHGVDLDEPDAKIRPNFTGLTDRTVIEIEEGCSVSSGSGLAIHRFRGKSGYPPISPDGGQAEHDDSRRPVFVYCGRRSAMMCQCQEPGLRCCCCLRESSSNPANSATRVVASQ